MSYTEKTWMLLFILMTEFGHGFTDMHGRCLCNYYILYIFLNGSNLRNKNIYIHFGLKKKSVFFKVLDLPLL